MWCEENRERERVRERARELIIILMRGEESVVLSQERQRVLTRGGREQKKRIK